VRQVDYLQILYRDARSTEHKCLTWSTCSKRISSRCSMQNISRRVV